MQNVFANNTVVPIKSWASNIEEGALAQAVNLANLPYAYHHIALMPDCHQVWNAHWWGTGSRWSSGSKCCWSGHWLWGMRCKN